ncbi:MAG: ribosome biogenesis GTPase YlqF [Candidatus Izimaplasma sp.]|nr:ribosome biogenesis GTPase YlqF [Candidatus Izimaplasma bacterium]
MKQIQWYPGHMAKTKKEIKERAKHVDVVLEIVDARCPLSSQNPIIDELVENKPRIILLNKADLSDENVLEDWIDFYEKQEIKALKINAIRKKGLEKIYPAMKELIQKKLDKEQKKGREKRALRALIIGIPNVGKSTLINALANKKKLVVGNKPGVTKHTQFIRVKKDFELLDTPGILWPKFEDEKVALNLALTGAIKDSILPLDDVVIYAFKYLDEHYKGLIEKRYEIDVDIDNIVQIFDDIGRKRGCLIANNEIDYDRVINLFLHDFRNHKIGSVILERPSDVSV